MQNIGPDELFFGNFRDHKLPIFTEYYNFINIGAITNVLN